MTSLLDAYFSLSLGLKSSSIPFVEIAIFTNVDFYKFFFASHHFKTARWVQKSNFRGAVLGVSRSITEVMRGQTTT